MKKRRSFFDELADSIKKAIGEFTYEVSKPLRPPVRPPGACPEDEFTRLCTACEKCVKACKANVLKKHENLKELAVLGTPYRDFSQNYCELCYECIKACPTGALSFDNLKKFKYVARISKDACVAFSKNILCLSCYWSCPNMDKAIICVDRLYPKINEANCEGCGRCVNACPLEEKALTLVLIKLSESS